MIVGPQRLKHRFGFDCETASGTRLCFDCGENIRTHMLAIFWKPIRIEMLLERWGDCYHRYHFSDFATGPSRMLFMETTPISSTIKVTSMK